MLKFFSYLYSHTKLLVSIYYYIQSYNVNLTHDEFLLDDIITQVKSCGSVSIKFCQWIVPKLEVMYINENDLLNKEFKKPFWLSKLEVLYDDCYLHPQEYTLSTYKRIFNENLLDKYKIINTIGSGSIGQVYLIESIPETEYITPKKYVLKIIHPSVNYELTFFRKFMRLLTYTPYIKQLIQKYIPFNIFHFIDIFETQCDFINEANHMLYFYEIYHNNNNIVIPRLIKCSSDILIMSYEEGTPYDDIDINNYSKYKLVCLFFLFIKNELHIYNYNHGDLHKGNWKLRYNTKDDFQLVIYDFGFCWSIEKKQLKFIKMITDIFESSDSGVDQHNQLKLEIVNKLADILECVLIDNNNNPIIFREKIIDFLKYKFKKNEFTFSYFSPINFFKLIITSCYQLNVNVDPILIQSIIVTIQIQRSLEEFSIQSNDKYKISSYEVYRSKYLDFITFCETYDIFPEYVQYMKQIFNDKKIEVNSVFDCIDLPDSFKELALLSKN